MAKSSISILMNPYTSSFHPSHKFHPYFDKIDFWNPETIDEMQLDILEMWLWSPFLSDSVRLIEKPLLQSRPSQREFQVYIYLFYKPWKCHPYRMSMFSQHWVCCVPSYLHNANFHQTGSWWKEFHARWMMKVVQFHCIVEPILLRQRLGFAYVIFCLSEHFDASQCFWTIPHLFHTALMIHQIMKFVVNLKISVWIIRWTVVRPLQ